MPRDLCFGRFVLRLQARELLSDGQPVRLGARAFDLLAVLASRPGRLFSRSELIDEVWQGLVVEENNLSVQINALRQAIGGGSIVTVLGRGYRFMAPVAATPASEPRPGAVPGQQLPEPQRLIGREDELAAVSALIAQRRLVTVLGAGGIGKTRLAQAVMHRHRGAFPDGAWFIELGSVDIADRLSQAPVEGLAHLVSAALGLSQSAGALPLASLVRQLEPLRLLLVLDNAEHVLEPLAVLLQAVLARAPDVRLLVTSQAPLRLSEESRYRLNGLSLPRHPVDVGTALAHGAVALFVARVAALDHRFELTGDKLPAVLDICRRLDGSALAIELAAARLPLLGLPALVQSLSRPLQALIAGRRDAPRRQQTLRAALQWSHDLLDAAEQAVFRRLAVFTASVSLPMAQAVLAEGGLDTGDGAGALPAGDAVLDLLGRLVERSLVQLQGADDATADAAAPRLRLLDAPLALATERLQASGERPALERRLAAVMLSSMESACDDLLQGRRGAARVVDDFAPEVDNAQAALRWALAHEPAMALRIAPLLSLLMGRHRYAEQLRVWHDVEPLLDGPPLLPPAPLARALLHCAEHWQNTRTLHARARAQAARDLALAAGDRRTAYLALQVIGPAAWRAGDLAALSAAVEAARAEHDAGWPPYVRQVLARNESLLCRLQEDHEGSIHWLLRHAALSRAAGASDVLARINIASAELAAGHFEKAAATSRELADSLQGGREQKYLCFALSNLSGSLLMLERCAETREVLRRSWPLARQFDMLPQWADDAALVAALEGRPCAALRLAGYADAAFATLGQPREAIDQARIDRACALALAALRPLQPRPDVTAAALRAEGAQIAEAELTTLCFATADA